jgi:hypothetical protein
MKIPPVRVELFRSDGRKDGRTDRHEKFIIAWSNFAKALKKGLIWV